MSNTIEQAQRILEQRIEELDAEREGLRRALASLETVEPGAAKPARAAKGRRKRRTRAGRGERERQLLASIEANPQLRVSDHARALGVRPQQLYPLLHKLESDGKIEKAAPGYRAAAGATAGASG